MSGISLPDPTSTASPADAGAVPVVAGRAIASDSAPVDRAKPADHLVTSSSRISR